MSKPAASPLAKAGMNILKRLVFDESTLPPENRRTDEREQVAGEVEVIILDPTGETVGTTRVFIRDVSKGGCGLWSRVAMPPGCSVMIKFPPQGKNPPVQRFARVQHCRGQAGTGFAIGIRYTDTEQHSKAA